ncbi:MAG: prenyltransferase [Bacteroidota bacterium]|jgi:1,4-dihydroxy-2-naphthoate octaprenyltransferase
MNKMKSLLGPMRVPFLILPPACVAVGAGTAFWQTHEISWIQILIILIGGLASHISANAFNEYFDFKSGLDAKTQRTPFSGGSGTLQAHPEMNKSTLYLAIITFVITAVVGFYFIWLRGFLLLPLGTIGLILLVTYTIWWAYNPILCLIAPGLGFGILMVMGTHFCLTGSYTWTSFVASLAPTFLVSDLLLLNQFPDVDADKSIGRKHFPITMGRQASAVLYGVFLLLAYVSVVIGVFFVLLPRYSLLALLTVIPAWKAYRGAYQNAENIPSLIPSMGLNVVINLTTPILLAVGLFIG